MSLFDKLALLGLPDETRAAVYDILAQEVKARTGHGPVHGVESALGLAARFRDAATAGTTADAVCTLADEVLRLRAAEAEWDKEAERHHRDAQEHYRIREELHAEVRRLNSYAAPMVIIDIRGYRKMTNPTSRTPSWKLRNALFAVLDEVERLSSKSAHYQTGADSCRCGELWPCDKAKRSG